MAQDKSLVRMRRLLERLAFQGGEAGGVIMDVVSMRDARRTASAWIRMARQLLRQTVTSWAHSAAHLWSQAAGSFTCQW